MKFRLGFINAILTQLRKTTELEDWQKMIVCVCNQISDMDICDSYKKGLNTFKDLQHDLGISTNCGSCAKLIQCWLNQNYQQDRTANCFDFKSVLINAS